MPKLTIVGVTCNNHSIHQIRQFIEGLKCQTNRDDWECLIYYDVIERPHPYFHSTDKVKFIYVDPAKGSYGNFNRLTGLETCDTEWITFTNIDNQMMPVLVQTALDHCNDCDILAWKVVHNYANGRYYEVLDPKPNVGDIDYCSYMIKTEVARKVGFNAIGWSGQDGLLIQQAVEQGARFKTINAVLAVHN